MAAPKAAILKDGTRKEFKSGEDFSQWMITEHLISTVPWDDAGAFVRFSVTFEAHGEDAEKRSSPKLSADSANPNSSSNNLPPGATRFFARAGRNKKRRF